jgi:MATE family multidrug resistance protein
MNVTNIALDLLLVIGFDWGVAGVAIATVISEWLVAVVGVVLLLRILSPGFGFIDAASLWHRERLAQLIHISGNLIVRSFFVQLPFFVFTLIGASLGDVVLAANAIVMQLFLTLVFALDGPAQTAETLCGFAYGAGDRRGLRNAMRFSLIWAVALAALLAILIAVSGELFIGWITTLTEVRDAAIALLPWIVAAPLISVWAFHFDGVFIGTTQTVTLRNSMFAAASVYLLLIWLGLEALGNQILWLAMMVFMGLRGALLAWLYPGIERQIEDQ